MKLELIALGVVTVVAGVYVWRKGGIANAASSIGAGVVNAAGSVVSGGVGAAGAAVGLPTPTETTTDPAVARWLIDNYGYFTASKWSGAPALFSAFGMAQGTGTPPPAGSALGRAFPVLPQASYDETDRLARRYPAPASSIFTNPAGVDFSNPDTWGLGL